ncbi:hypothetical protein L596_015786 [Steinernema carpocapsae]|uniref:Uncharacterized protein n=1 Tax=Steinernema carpocapsae TaxID=34508 RepID=A0A4U5NH02_STECR|nr:hypothetical protein L596_015786 [Steinernema carpocapsae]
MCHPCRLAKCRQMGMDESNKKITRRNSSSKSISSVTSFDSYDSEQSISSPKSFHALNVHVELEDFFDLPIPEPEPEPSQPVQQFQKLSNAGFLTPTLNSYFQLVQERLVQHSKMHFDHENKIYRSEFAAAPIREISVECFEVFTSDLIKTDHGATLHLLRTFPVVRDWNFCYQVN